MKKTFLILTLLLTGCSTTVPVAVKFPEVPKELLQGCPDLKSVNQDAKKLSEILDVIVDNYGQYYDCKSTTDDWIEWYNTQKKIFDKVSK